MDRSVYDTMRAIEDRHWWFRARREILADQLQRLDLPGGARILEVGCGVGGNLGMLSRFGQVTAVEPDEDSRAYAQTKAGVPVLAGRLPDSLPAFDAPFDLIAALDVVEHVDEDAATLAALRGLLAPQGVLVTTVPAHPWMWSRHDELHHHKRRYRLADYLRLFPEAGLRVRKASYFNSVLFPAIAAVRLARLGEGANDALPPAPVNGLLQRLFAAERFALRTMDLPFGVSLLVIAEPA